jgi:hypothetical protein
MKLCIDYNCLLLAMGMILFQSCRSVKQSPKYGFNEGYYKSKIHHKKLKKVYIVPGDDSIKVYTQKTLKKAFIDTMQSFKIAFPSNSKPAEFEQYSFRQNTFDIDAISIILRYRPAVAPFPNQFSSAPYNVAAYFGYRTDLYHMKYEQTPLGAYRRNMLHYGFSFGAFTGIGSGNINSSVTADSVNVSYDALINVSGLAAFIGVERFTYGVTLGFDHLPDKNRKHWIYQGKPWIGLSIGWNLH